jgi:flagellar basal body P-ring formation protein FlgA
MKVTAMTFRQLRWLTTLYRGSQEVAPLPPPVWHRNVAVAVMALLSPTASAAGLHAFGELAGPLVHLSDLFDSLGAAPDRVLGPAPAPGDRIVVEAPQLAAIARDYSVDWRPQSGAERVVLERSGDRLPQAAIVAPLRAALTGAGASTDADISLPGFDPPLIPSGATPKQAVTDTNFDPATGRFTAMLTVTAPGMATVHARLSGQVAAMAQAVALTRHLHPGTILAAGDLQEVRVRISQLRGNAPLTLEAATGQALRHDMASGQPLTSADVSRPVLVARNGNVRMRLDAGGIQLQAQGIALEEGGLGETIKVQNPSSRAVVLAEVTAAGEVRVVPDRAPLIVASQ